MRCLPLVFLLACAPDDLDWDGFVGDEDCAPEDPAIYPGAPDAPGDGIDQDCDGEDPPPLYEGTWTVDDLQALYSTFEAIVPDTTTGELVVDVDGAATLDATGDLDGDLVGAQVPIMMDFTGAASATPNDGQVALYLTGDLDATVYQETSFTDLLCDIEDGWMDCHGTLKALDTTLLVYVTFFRD